ncbi:MAG: DUF6586 family protein [Pseudomonadota bacterium]|nr:DUF6586 family protein [Pseudomonadota bacterium]
MASQWHSLVSQKLFLAGTLLRQIERAAEAGAGAAGTEQALQREAALQGAIELMLRGRQLLLVMIARLYQDKSGQPDTLGALGTLIGKESSEVIRLRELEQTAGSWWNHLDQLETSQGRPPATRKTVSAENIIAISTETGPDRSVSALLETLAAIKQFANELEEQHSEW